MFAYLFAKKDRANIDDDELLAFRKLAELYRRKTQHRPSLMRKSVPAPYWRFFAMATKRKFKSDAFEAIHSAVEDMYSAGTIDKETMKTFDETCLSIPQELTPSEIKALRENNHVSQPVFARYLNTSESTVQKWETGAKRPSGPALKLLSIVRKHGLEMLS